MLLCELPLSMNERAYSKKGHKSWKNFKYFKNKPDLNDHIEMLCFFQHWRNQQTKILLDKYKMN